MYEIEGDGFEVSMKMFDKVVNKVDKSNKRNYDFFVKTGPKFKTAIYHLGRRMIRDKHFPGSFNKTVLHMVFKGGVGKRKEVLKSNRFLHCKSWLPSLIEGVVVEKLKPTILRRSSMYQVGGESGHRPQELLFVMRSTEQKYLAQKKRLLLQPFNIEAFFDREQLLDGMDTLHRMNTNPHDWKC